MFLGGDVGGTNTRLAIFEEKSGRCALVREARYRAREHGGLAEIVRAFLKESGARPRAACLGVAGPVRDGRATATNLPWVIDGAELAREVGIADVWLLNDLEANAWGIRMLGAADVETLHAGVAGAAGNRAVISAGTGLGEAGLFWNGSEHLPFACEGGHADFAPFCELSVELWRSLRAQHEHVSWEHVLSGQGLRNIYEFLRDVQKIPGKSFDELPAEFVVADDLPATIARAGLARVDRRSEMALHLLVSFYGAEAGNAALKFMATGGVYLGGGIAPKILPRLREGPFLEQFFAKGRLAPLLRTIPVHVITNDKTALLGAGLCALRRSGARIHAA